MDQRVMKTTILTLFILLLFFISCKQEASKRRIETDETIDYKEVLFGVEDSLKVYEVNFRLQAKQMVDVIEKKEQKKHLWIRLLLRCQRF